MRFTFSALVVFGMCALAPSMAQAQTLEELESHLAELQAELPGLKTARTVANGVLAEALADVVEAQNAQQQWLTANPNPTQWDAADNLMNAQLSNDVAQKLIVSQLATEEAETADCAVTECEEEIECVEFEIENWEEEE